MRPSIIAALLCVLVVAAAGCGDESIASQQRSSHANAAGTCSRVKLVLDDLIVHPQSCTNTASCPVGSFCSPETGVCDFQCQTGTSA